MILQKHQGNFMLSDHGVARLGCACGSRPSPRGPRPMHKTADAGVEPACARSLRRERPGDFILGS